MAQRLPKVGGDDNEWGVILNGFLQVAHNDDGTLKAPTVFPTYQLQIDYDANNNPIYIGEALRGTDPGSTGWTIMKVSYNTSGNPIVFQTSDGIWNDRTSLTYS